ncbi:unnamed protein product, partial [Adineta ricciae]
MFRLKTFISLFVVLSALITAEDPCRFEHTKGTIDLSSLGRIDGKPAYPDEYPPVGSNYLYSYNPCKPFSEGATCNNVAVCQISKDKQFTFILGKQESAEWNPGRGLGTNPSITYTYDTKQASIQLMCATDETNQLEVLGEGPTNFYKFRLINKCACWDGCKGVPPQQNCTINGTVYTSDKQIIQSFPFPVSINPSQSLPSPPKFSYATVDTNRRVINLTLVNIPSIPPGLFCLGNLQELSIFDSPSVTIPSEIGRLSTSLQSLTMSQVSRSAPLPAELFNLSRLSTLSIVNCGLEALSEDVGRLSSLNQLTLDENLLVSLPWSLNKLPSLTSLSINNNSRLSSLDVLAGSTSLNTLRASNCIINHIPNNIPNLRTIELNNNQLTSLDGLETIT